MKSVETNGKEENAHKVKLPTTGMDLAPRNGALLSPKPIGPNQGHQHGHAMTCHREGDADLVKFETFCVGWRTLEAEQLGDEDALHCNDHRGAEVGEKRSLEGCAIVSFLRLNARPSANVHTDRDDPDCSSAAPSE